MVTWAWEVHVHVHTRRWAAFPSESRHQSDHAFKPQVLIVYVLGIYGTGLVLVEVVTKVM